MYVPVRRMAKLQHPVSAVSTQSPLPPWVRSPGTNFPPAVTQAASSSVSSTWKLGSSFAEVDDLRKRVHPTASANGESDRPRDRDRLLTAMSARDRSRLDRKTKNGYVSQY
jgi:hypothetical protein